MFIAAVGPPASNQTRARWVTRLLAAGGIEADDEAAHGDLRQHIAAFSSSGARAAIIVTAEEESPSLASELGHALREAGALRVLVAGRAADTPTYTGVDEVVFEGCDVLGILGRLLDVLEMKR